VERGRRAERRLVTIVASRPRIRELVFEGGERKVAHDQAETPFDARHMRHAHVAQPADDRAQGTEDRVRVFAVGPQFLELPLVEEHAAEVRLRIEVDREHGLPLIREHVGQVVDEGRLADATLVVEEGNGLHGRLRIVTSTYPLSKTNSASGLPFLARASWARRTPRP